MTLADMLPGLNLLAVAVGSYVHDLVKGKKLKESVRRLREDVERSNAKLDSLTDHAHWAHGALRLVTEELHINVDRAPELGSNGRSAHKFEEEPEE